MEIHMVIRQNGFRGGLSYHERTVRKMLRRGSVLVPIRSRFPKELRTVHKRMVSTALSEGGFTRFEIRFDKRNMRVQFASIRERFRAKRHLDSYLKKAIPRDIVQFAIQEGRRKDTKTLSFRFWNSFEE